MKCKNLLERLAEFVQSPNKGDIEGILAELRAFPECLDQAAALVARAQLFSGKLAGSECYSRLELIQYFNDDSAPSRKTIADHIEECCYCQDAIKSLEAEITQNMTAFKDNPEAALETFL